MALGSYAAGAAALTWPAVLHPRDRLLGGLRSDACTHVWTLWWAARALVERGALLVSRTDLICHPGGGRLVSPSPLHDLLMAPVTLTAGPIAAYNLVMLANLLLAGYGAFALTRHLLRDARPALVAGAVFGLSPFALTYAVASGGTELVATGWIPLATLGLLRTLRETTWRPPVMTGLAVAAMALTCIYHVAVFALLATALVLHQLTIGRRPAWDLSPPGRGTARAPDTAGRAAVRLALAALLAAALAGPYVVQLAASLRAPDSILSSRVTALDRSPAEWAAEPGIEEMVRRGATHHLVPGDAAGHTPGAPRGRTDPFLDPAYAQSYASVFLVNLVLPGPQGAQRLDVVARFLLNPYIGLTTLALACVGLALHPRRSRWVWLGLTCAFVLVAMGPFLMVSQRVHLLCPTSPLHRALDHLGPLHPPGHDATYFVAAMLALAVLAGHGTAVLLSAAPRRAAPAVVAAVTLAFVADVRWLSGVPWPLPSDPVVDHACHADLAATAVGPGAHALLELPLYVDGALLTRREVFCHQPLHGRPLVHGIGGYQPPLLRDNPLVTALIGIERGGPARDPDAALQAGVRQLRDAGVDAVAVDGRAYPDGETRTRETELLDALLGPPRRYDDGYLLYRLDP